MHMLGKSRAHGMSFLKDTARSKTASRQWYKVWRLLWLPVGRIMGLWTGSLPTGQSSISSWWYEPRIVGESKGRINIDANDESIKVRF